MPTAVTIPLDSAAIHLTAVGHAGDEDESLGVVDGVHDAILTDADAVVVASHELLTACRTGLYREPVDRLPDPLTNGWLEPAKRAGGGRMEPNFVTGRRRD